MINSLMSNGTANSNLYVANLPPSTSEEIVRQLFREFGEARRSRVASLFQRLSRFLV